MADTSTLEGIKSGPEARYGYYRRCQVARKGGEQCKAPAEKGELICHAHAAQQALAVRRERERQAVLAEAVAEMRRRGTLESGRAEFEAKDLFMDFKGIQITVAKMAQALIDGRIDCKTAGRLAVHLQTMSKLLWLACRQKRKTLPRINTDNTDSITTPDIESLQHGTESHKSRSQSVPMKYVSGQYADQVAAGAKTLAFPASSREYAGSRKYWHGQQTRAA
ncbi:MAG TPA: hypothetical protein VHA06_04830 [Candidatus Angelobacter sp.]|nr:hypothetical protein [Candidatus Angelobacter sp.]